MLDSCKSINLGGKLLDVTTPIVMGIINLTPDSFYESSRKNSIVDTIKHVEKMVSEGAEIIDCGAFSSKPGVELIDVEEEWRRLETTLIQIRKTFPEINLSLDTYRSEIVRRAKENADIQIVNDISGGAWDSTMFSTVAQLKVAYVLMHIQGKPNTMQQMPHYENITSEIILSLSEKIFELKLMGVCDIIVDPGFGFGKSLDHNYELLNRMGDFRSFELPVLVGFSRKSMIYNLLDTTPEFALNGTSALHMLALQNGAKILRVHDVKEAVECVKIYNKFTQFN
ncbi:MAG: dihydropteroate synthase [Breznakibacter sp.]|nr:dihydropteroate synthase [Breznakibacter sp.]